MEILKRIEATRANNELLDKGEITFDEYTRRQNELDSEELDYLFKMASREYLTDQYYLGVQDGLSYATNISFLVKSKEFDSLPLEAKIAVYDFRKRLSEVIGSLSGCIAVANGHTFTDEVPL